MLFRISGTEVFVCGTIHLLPADEPLPPRLLSALAAADDCVFESDPTRETGEPDFARYPAGDSLDRHIPAELFTALTAHCESLDLPGLLPSCKPWWVALLLGGVPILRAGNLPGFGVDTQLWNAALRAGKRPFVMESAEVLRLFDSAPFAEQVSRLARVVAEPDRPLSGFQRLLTAWRTGDVAALDREAREQCEEFPVSYRLLFDDRNRRWLPGILGAVQRRRRALFAVGAMHLAGEHSLQRLVTEHGHTLLPV